MMLMRGSSGPTVMQLQKALHLIPDGRFGYLTCETLQRWQREHGLEPTGKADNVTLMKLLPAVYKRSSREITHIIVHCTATPEGQARTVEQLRVEHKRKGWSDIGYHYVVYLDGSVHTGRDVDIVGAHCQGHNAHSIGVVYVGGLENDPKKKYIQLQPKDTRTDAQKAGLLRLLHALRQQYPFASIVGHRDMSPDKNGNGIVEPREWVKACPSFDAVGEYRDI